MAMRRLIGFGLVLLLVAAGLFAWSQHRQKERAEEQLGLESARVLTAAFDRTNALQVGRLSGEVLARSEEKGCLGLCQVEQTTRAPYSVVYTVNLSKLREENLRWNADERVMIVDAPSVDVGEANVDDARARTSQSGVWISRRSGQALQRSAALRLGAAARQKANDPANVAKAQAAAREAIATNLRLALGAAGMGDVEVVVRLPGEARPADLPREQWDMSRPISEVLAELRG
jgi:hypothetical protein